MGELIIFTENIITNQYEKDCLDFLLIQIERDYSSVVKDGAIHNSGLNHCGVSFCLKKENDDILNEIISLIHSFIIVYGLNLTYEYFNKDSLILQKDRELIYIVLGKLNAW